jgi:hypothetical protein
MDAMIHRLPPATLPDDDIYRDAIVPNIIIDWKEPEPQ